MLLALLVAASSTIPLPVLGRTWVVDDQPGPGVDFTTLQAAFTASAPLDVILVQPGTYAGATLNRGVRVIGIGEPTVNGTIYVQNLPSGPPAILAGLRSSATQTSVWVQHCAAAVVLDDVRSNGVHASYAADIRVHRAGPFAQGFVVSAVESRMELVECTLRAPDVADSDCGPGQPGNRAAVVSGRELRATRCTFAGGRGGSVTCGWCWPTEPAGSGGEGIFAASGARLVVSGLPAHSLVGGIGGTHLCGGLHGAGAPGVFALGAGTVARISGITSPTWNAANGAVVTTVSPADPTLRLLETAVPGALLTLRIVAPPGSSASIAVGSLPIVVPIGTIEEDVLVGRARTELVGVLPAEGVISWNFRVPPTWPVGTTVFAQATLTYPGGEVRRTNSVPVIVR